MQPHFNFCLHQSRSSKAFSKWGLAPCKCARLARPRHFPELLTAHGSSERICKSTDSQGPLEFQILFTNAESATKAIEHGEFECKYGPMRRRIAFTLRRERPAQNLRSPESRPRPRANTIPPGSSAVSPTNHSPRSHSDDHQTCQANASTGNPRPASPIVTRLPNNGTPQTSLNGIRPHLPTHPANHVVDTPSARANTTSLSPAFYFDTAPTKSLDGIGVNQLADEVSKLRIELAVRDNEVAQLRKKLEDPNSHDRQPPQHAVGDIECHNHCGDALAVKVADQSTEIIRLEDEVSSLKARDLQSEEDKKGLQAELKRKVTRIQAVTRNVNRMRNERIKLVAKNITAKRRLKVLGEELKVAREASARSQEALRNEFDAYKNDQLRIGAQLEREHKELLRASIANQAEHQKLLQRVQKALDERSKQVALLEEQRDQDVSRMTETDRNVDMLRTSLSRTERAAATTHERLFAAEHALIHNQGDYEKKCAEISAARRKITSLREALTVQERAREAVVQQLKDIRASAAQLQQDRLIDNQRYEAQLSREREAFEATLFEAQLRAQEAARAEASSKETVFSALDIARREMSDQMARERDAFASILTRAEDDVRNVRSLLDIERENCAFLQEKYKLAQSSSKPVVYTDSEAQTEPVVTETHALQNNIQSPHALDSLLQAFVAMRDLGISVAPRATDGATDQH